MTARAALLLVLAAVVACTMRPGPPPRTGPHVIVIPKGAAPPKTVLPVVAVEVAATNATRERGLMGRESVPDGTGMLFVYPFAAPHTFWMGHCLVSLDIAFVSQDRRILSIATLPPGAGLPEERVAKAESPGPVLFVLETPGGWLAKNGVAAGDLIDLDAVFSE